MATPEEPEPQTLAAGELVWAKTKGRQHWLPARLRAACPAAAKDAPVSCFGDADGDDEPRSATRLRRFADPAADKMARASTARGFLNAVEVAHAAAVALLCTGLTCACASPAAPAPAPAATAAAAAAEGVVVGGVDNLSPSEFLASIRSAALDPPAVGLLDRVRLKSWTRALAQGWGPAGAGHQPRRSVEELVDKIDLDDLNEPAEEEGDAADEDSDKAMETQLKTPAQGKRRGRPRKDASLTKQRRAKTPVAREDDDQKDTDAGEKGDQRDTDAGENINQKHESPGAELSTGRKRKKSKYLSPPYTTSLGVHALEEKIEKKPADLPKESSVPSASKEEKKALRDNVDAGEVLELVRSFGEDVFHESQFSKAAERFLGLFRSKNFAGVDAAAGLVSDSGAALKLGNSVLERSRKKDEVGAGGSSIKRKKKMEKTSPTATLDFPAENAVAEASADVAGLVSDSSAAMEKGKGVTKRGRKKKDQDGSVGSSIKRKKVAKTSPKATPELPAENVSADTGAEGTGLVPHSCATAEQGKGVVKRGRKKKDQDGSGGSSIKRKKKVAKTSPKATPELPAENVSANTGAEGTGLVPHSCATAEQGKGVVKRGRKKKDKDGSGGPSIKRKKMAKTSPTPILDSGLVITPAIPIRQVRAGDLISQVRSGIGAGMGVGVLDQNNLEFNSPILDAMLGGMISGEEQDQADGGSVVKTPVTTIEATKQGAHTNMENVIADLAAKSVQAEEAKPGMGIQVDMNVQSGMVDVPIASVHMELGTTIPADTNEQGVVTDLPVRSGLLPNHGGISQPADGNTNNANVEVSTVQGVVADVAVRSGLLPNHGGISQPADGNTNNANVVEVRAVQESYASLEAMVPEMYKKADKITTGTNVTATNHAFKAEGQLGEQTTQMKTTGEAIANHAPAISTNGTYYSDAPNSTPKRRNKKAPQYFPNPVEIVLQFTDGVILPTKEELLSAFSKFGTLIEPLSDILGDAHGARVVFGKSAEADAVYARRETPGLFGQFGPPFATLKVLNYLPPFTPSIPPPPPALKPPLGIADMRKNVENMMSALASRKASSSAGANPVPEYLLGDMQRLLSRIDKVQPGPSSSSASAPQ